MNVPVGDNRSVSINSTTLNHWVTVVLGIVVGLIGWSYQVQQSQLDRLQIAYQNFLQVSSTQSAESRAHEIGDLRMDEMGQATAKKQVEVLSRLTAIETALHDLQLEVDRVRGIDGLQK